MERCDRCIAQALWIFSAPEGSLYLCNHHANQHAAALIAVGFFQTRIVEGVPDELAEVSLRT